MSWLRICPADIPGLQQSLSPSISQANENCLLSIGGGFAFKPSDETTEIRVRIIVESVVHEEYNLDNKNLKSG